MSLLSVVQSVCATVGVQVPTSVFSGITGNRTMTEMLDLANEMAKRIAYDTRDWTRLRQTATLFGDGVVDPAPPGLVIGTTAFDLPADYKRMLLTTNVWRSTYQNAPMMFVPDTDEWLNRRARQLTTGFSSYSYNYGNGEWTMLGGQIHIFPVMAVGQNAFFVYLIRNCIALNSGGVGDSFLSDLDSFLLDERLLKLGMIWQWKAQKGSPYNEDLGTFQDALSSAAGRDSPAPIIIGRPPVIDRYGYGNANIRG